MTTPRRIQMTRTAGGWRKDHPDAVIVDRRTPWGNPFIVGTHGDAQTCVARFRALIGADGAGGSIDTTTQPAPPFADQLNTQVQVRDCIHTLRGRDLACWCKPGSPCHADVLLELANRVVEK